MTFLWRLLIVVALLGYGWCGAQTLLLDAAVSKGDNFYFTGLDDAAQPLWEDGVGSGGFEWIGAGQLYGGFVQTNAIGSIVQYGQVTLSFVDQGVFDPAQTERFLFDGAATLIGSSEIVYLSGFFQSGWYEMSWVFSSITYEPAGNYQIDSGGQAPIITQHPENITVEAGQPFELSAAADSGQAQWFKDGEGMGGVAPSADAATTLHAGVYEVTFTNANGVSSSQPATVSVIAPSTMLTMEAGEGTITLRWESCMDHRYYILHSADLLHWEPTGLSYTGDGSLMEVQVSAADASNQFYKLLIDYP